MAEASSPCEVPSNASHLNVSATGEEGARAARRDQVPRRQLRGRAAVRGARRAAADVDFEEEESEGRRRADQV